MGGPEDRSVHDDAVAADPHWATLGDDDRAESN